MRWESAVKAWGFGGCGAWGRERRHSGGIENCNDGFAEKPWLSNKLTVWNKVADV